MLKWDGLHPATLSSVFIEAQCFDRNRRLVTAQTGTGFFFRRSGRVFLITNWHVLTGRNPDDPFHMLIQATESPVHIEVWMPQKANQNHFVPEGIDLYSDGVPVWIEFNNGQRTDLAAIELPPMANAHVVAIQDFIEEGECVEVGNDVVVVGYPLGHYNGNVHATWKRAMVATEPGIAISGKAQFYLDVAGRPGMSGSPVYATSTALRVTPNTARILKDPKISASEKVRQLGQDWVHGETKSLYFIGIYAGALAEGRMRELNLGFCWHGGLLDLLFDSPVVGHNPEPPPT